MTVSDFIARLGAEVEDAAEGDCLKGQPGSSPLAPQQHGNQNLGIIDSKSSSLDVAVGGRDLTIKQSPTVLNSAREGGTTGAVVWKVTPRFAEWLTSPDNLLFRHGVLSADSAVLELGSGIAGIVPVTLAPLVRHYIATDQVYALKLLKENIEQNTSTQGGRAKKTTRKTKGEPQQNLQVLSLDWEKDDVESFLKANNAAQGIDLVIACDCIYNYALIRPFVQTCADACKLKAAGSPTICVIAQQLRQPDVFEEWLDEFGKYFRTWKLADEVLTPPLKENSGFVVHVGILRTAAPSAV